MVMSTTQQGGRTGSMSRYRYLVLALTSTALVVACSSNTDSKPTGTPDAGQTSNVCVSCTSTPDWAWGCAVELSDCMADSSCKTWYTCATNNNLFPTPLATYNTLNAPCLREAGILTQSGPSFQAYRLFATCVGYRCDCLTDYNPATGNPAANAPDDTSGVCQYDAPNGCGDCACSQCTEAVTACMNDSLCAALMNCLAAKECTTFEDCFASSKCAAEGIALGGGGSQSYKRFVLANTCAKSKCDSCATAPKDTRNSFGLQSVTDGG